MNVPKRFGFRLHIESVGESNHSLSDWLSEWVSYLKRHFRDGSVCWGLFLFVFLFVETVTWPAWNTLRNLLNFNRSTQKSALALFGNQCKKTCHLSQRKEHCYIFVTSHYYYCPLKDGDAQLAQRHVPLENGEAGDSLVPSDMASRSVQTTLNLHLLCKHFAEIPT